MFEFEKVFRGEDGILMTMEVKKDGFLVGFIERVEESPMANWNILDVNGKRQELWGMIEFELWRAKQAAIELFK